MSSPGLGTRIWRLLLSSGALRRRLAFHLTQYHFRDLQLRLPLAGGLACPVHTKENLYSFGEIFCQHEYAGLWARLSLPRRWIDLGAHAGYFSLDVAARHAAAGTGGDWKAVLVEPDPRMREVIEDGVRSNELASQVTLLTGLIAASGEAAAFALREGMLSSSAVGANDGEVTHVPVIAASALLAALPPPYDLIKVDIEGGEYEFVRAYAEVLRHARACVIEWHAPTQDDARRQVLAEAMRAAGLTHRVTLCEPRTGTGTGELAVTGVELFLADLAELRPAAATGR